MNGTISPDSVRSLAYQLWEQRGCQGGSPEEDWLRAEQILHDQDDGQDQGQVTPNGLSSDRQAAAEQLDHAVEESFPASDPPAVHQKDEPPVNAGEKWRTARNARGSARRG